MTTAAQLVATEAKARKDADAALSARIAALEAAGKPPALPAGATVVQPGDDIAALLLSGHRLLYLRTGVHRFALGSVPTTYANVSILAYPGDSPVIDGTGLDPHFVYLDSPSGTWTLGAVKVQNFRPVDSGIIGVGDGCHLETLAGFTIKGMGQPKSATVPWDINSHGIYCHGTGTYHGVAPDITGIPGAALHHYRGTPVSSLDGGRLGSYYESAIVYSGTAILTNVAFVEPTAAWDIQVSGDATGHGAATLSTCTGTGPADAVRRVG